MVSILLATCATMSCAQAPPTIEEFLRTKNVANNVAALEAGLKSSDPSVRGASAMQLTVLKSTNSIPAIRAALDREHDPQEMLNIGRALTAFGDPHGETVPRSVCSASNVSEKIRIQAAQDLSSDLGPSCILALSRMVGSSTDDGAIYAGLWTIAREQPEKAAELGADPTVVLAFQSGLRNSDQDTRAQAARCIVIYKARSAVPALSAAIKKEADSGTKKQMLEVLDAVSH